MNKSQFVSSLAGKLWVVDSIANDLLGVVLQEIQDVVLSGNDVNFKGFGKFELRTKANRKGYNMHTKEVIDIPSFTTIGFKPSKNFRKLVKEKF